MAHQEDIPQGWQREGNFLYTAEFDSWRKGKAMWHNRLTVHVQGYNSTATEDEISDLASRIFSFLSAPASPVVEAAAAPLGDAELAELLRKVQRLRIDINEATHFGLGGYFNIILAQHGNVNDEQLEALADDAGNTLEELLHALPGLLTRLAAAEAKVAAIEGALTDAEQAREQELRGMQAKAALGDFVPTRSGYAAHMGELINIINKLRQPLLPLTVKGGPQDA